MSPSVQRYKRRPKFNMFDLVALCLGASLVMLACASFAGEPKWVQVCEKLKKNQLSEKQVEAYEKILNEGSGTYEITLNEFCGVD